MNQVLLILGTPGVGKSSLALSLGRKLGIEFIDLGPLVRSKRLYKRYDPRTRSYVIDEGRVKTYLRRRLHDRRAVIATHFIDRLIPPGSVSLAIVMRLDPIILSRRLKARGWTERKVWENTESEIIDLCLEEAVRALGRWKVVEIDTTKLTAKTILSRAMAAVNLKRKTGRFRVDWLSKYDPVILEKKLRWKNSTS
jgi:adenylate kinase